MTPDRWLITLLGFGLIAAVAWFFWLKRVRGVRAALTAGGFQEIMILVKGGYTPAAVVVSAGKPVRLIFRREESGGCADKVQLADFSKHADLPEGKSVPVEFLPEKPGEYAFSCPMGMYRGKIIVE